MSTLFWILAALAVAAALALLLWPLLRASRSGAVAAQTALLREQLDALKSAHAAGLVGDADFATRQQALSAAALKLIDQPASARPALSGSARVIAVLLLLGIPIATLLLYEQVGTPNALGFSGPGPAASAPEHAGETTSNAPGLAQAAQTLAEKLRDNPQDGEGWALLARTHRAMEDFASAAQAYERALALLPESADLLVEAAEAKGLSADPRTLRGQPERWVDRALELEPQHQNALFLKGLARAQADDPNTAEATWERLLKLMEPGSEAQQAVLAQLNIVRSRLGKEALAQADATSSASASATPPTDSRSEAAGIEVSVRIADTLATKVGADDVLYVYARAEQGPPAPLAIQRLSAAAIPVALRLDESMGMVQGLSLTQFPRVVIGARISKSGNAAPQPGDLEGLSAALDWRAARRVEVVIDRVR
ncbi:MAG: c-type cytochrome biogenesis protein CcmI [Xanthomonadales bacterium]|nr:hypothetical protein [Xanthomonadales bacterium]MCC6593448.1 c-type cytochrome biogenesis protein CcmI [Xanthomonadales bacterium]